MDGVLADFVRGAMLHHHRPDHDHDKTEWGLEAQFGIMPEQFWASLDYDFWAGLKPLDDGLDLLEEVEFLVGRENVCIVTSPCDTAGCLEGKRDWIKQYLPDYKKRLVLTSAKHLLAGPRKLLIDDHDANYDKFTTACGRGVLVPRPWNRNRDLCEFPGGKFRVPDAAVVVEKILESMK